MKPILPHRLIQALLTISAAALPSTSPAFADVPESYTPVTITSFKQLANYTSTDYIAFIISNDITDSAYRMTGAHQYWIDYMPNTHVLTFEKIESAADGGAMSIVSELIVEHLQGLSFSQNKSTSHNDGGALCTYYSNVCFTENVSVTFSGNTCGGRYGGAIYAVSSDVCFAKNDTVTFNENSMEGIGNGGAINVSSGDVSFMENGSVTFTGNTAGENGGAIYTSSGDVGFTKNGSVTFTGNTAKVNRGGAIYAISYAISSDVCFTENNSVTFSSNSAPSGGAIYADTSSSVSFAKNGTVIFNWNTAKSNHGGAICASSDVSFTENKAITFSSNFADNSIGSRGGAIYAYSNTISIEDNDSVMFSRNTARGSGGAVCLYSDSTINMAGNSAVEFNANSAYTTDSSNYKSIGGAIYGGSGSIISLTGNGSVTFRGNYEKRASTYRLRSMYADGGTLKLAAGEGQNITFYDTLYASSSATISFNAQYQDKDGIMQDAKGDIVFSGAHAEEDLGKLKQNYTQDELTNSLTTVVNTTTNLYGGRLRIEDGAIYKGYGINVAADSNATLRLAGGALSQAGYNVILNAGTTLDVQGANGITATTLDMQDGSSLSFTIGEANLTNVALALDGAFNQDCNLTINIQGDETYDAEEKYMLITLASGKTPTTWDATMITLTGIDTNVNHLIWEGGTLCYSATPPLVTAIWRGERSREWNFTDKNWEQEKILYCYKDVVDVVFGNVGSGEVVLVDEVKPLSVLVENSEGHDYTFTGEGQLTGEMQLTKEGDGTLTIGTANDYTGGTVINGGVVVVDNATALGSGDIALNGGELDIATDATISGQITVNDENKLVVTDGHVLTLGRSIANNYYLEMWGTYDISNLSIEVLESEYVGGAVEGNGFAQSNKRIQVINNSQDSRCDISEAAFLYKGAEVALDSTCAFNISATNYTKFFVNTGSENYSDAWAYSEAHGTMVTSVVLATGTSITADMAGASFALSLTGTSGTVNATETTNIDNISGWNNNALTITGTAPVIMPHQSLTMTGATVLEIGTTVTTEAITLSSDDAHLLVGEGGELIVSGNNSLYLRHGLLEVYGKVNIGKELDMSNSRQSTGTLLLHSGAEMTVANSMWLNHTAMGVRLEKDASFAIDVKGVKFTGKEGGGSITAASGYEVNYASYDTHAVVSNVVMEATCDITIANQLNHVDVKTGKNLVWLSSAATTVTVNAEGTLNVSASGSTPNIIVEDGGTIGNYIKANPGETTISSQDTAILAEVIDLQSGKLTMTGKYNIDILPLDGKVSYKGGAVDGNGFALEDGTVQVVSIRGGELDASKGTFLRGGIAATVTNGVATVSGTNYAGFYINSGTETLDAARSKEDERGPLSFIYVKENAKLQVTDNINATLISADSAGTVSIDEGKTVTAASARVFTLDGKGTYALGNGSGSLNSVRLGAGWEGTVLVTDCTLLLDFASLANAKSTIELQGYTGWAVDPTWYGTNSRNIKLTDSVSSDGTTVIAWDNGAFSSTWAPTCTFSGTWSGNGTFRASMAPIKYMNYTYSGDVSAWNGKFISTGVTDLTFYGKATQVNAAISCEDGTLSMIVGDGQSYFNTTFGNNVTASSLQVAAHASATLAGTTNLNGVTLANDATLINSGDMTLSGTISFGQNAIQNNGGGTIDFGDDIHFDLRGMTAEDNVYTLFAGTGASIDLSGFDKSYITVAGGTEGHDWFFGKDGTITIDVGPELTWNGAASRLWNTTDANWTNRGESSAFRNNSQVIFDNDGSGNVILEGSLAPFSVLVDNSTNNDYSFTGDGMLTGRMQLTKEGDGTLTIGTANDYTGGTVINGGVVVVDNATALGSGDVALNGAELDIATDATISGQITVDGDNYLIVEDGCTLSLGSSIANNYYLEMQGAFDISNLSAEVRKSEYIGGAVKGNGFFRGELQVQVVDNVFGAYAEMGEASFLYNGIEGVAGDDGEVMVMTRVDYTRFFVFHGEESLGKALDAASAAGAEVEGITMSAGTTLHVDRDMSADFVSVASGSVKLDLKGSNTVTEGATPHSEFILTGSGVYALASSNTALAPSLDSEGWTGTVALKDIVMNNPDFLDLDNYGHEGSTVRLDGVKTNFGANGNTFSATMELTGDGLEITACQGNRSYEFAGGVKGDGNIIYNLSTPAHNQTYIFSGDVSDWTGAYVSAANKTSTLEFTGDATVMGADIIREQGIVNVVAVGDEGKEHTIVFKGDVQASNLTVQEYAKAVIEGNAVIDKTANKTGVLSLQGTLEVADGGSLALSQDASVQVGDAFTVAGKGASAPALSGNLEITEAGFYGIGDKAARIDHSVIKLEEGASVVFDNVILGASSQLKDDPATVVVNNMVIEGILGENVQEGEPLTIKSGSVLHLTGDPGQTVVIEEDSFACTFDITNVQDVQLSGNCLTIDLSSMYPKFKDMGESFDWLGIALGSGDHAPTIDENLEVVVQTLPNQRAHGYVGWGGTFVTVPEHGENVGPVIYFHMYEVPEPTTSTLSLLALAALAARRRRVR